MKKNSIRICGRKFSIVFSLVSRLLVISLCKGFFGSYLLIMLLSVLKLLVMVFVMGLLMVYIVWNIRNMVSVSNSILNIGCRVMWLIVLLWWLVGVGIIMVLVSSVCIFMCRLFGFVVVGEGMGVCVLMVVISVCVLLCLIVMVLMIGMFRCCDSVVMLMWILCWVVVFIMFSVSIMGWFRWCIFSMKCKCRCRLVVLVM